MQKNMSRKSFLAGAGTVAAAAVAGSAAVALADDAKAAAPAAEGNIITRETLEQGTWSFMVAPEPVAEDQIAETKTHEIVVVGSGAAGLCCAVSAAEQGADVIVFSAGTKPLSRGGSFQAIGTKYQAEHGVEDDPEKRRVQTQIDLIAGARMMDSRKWMRWENNSAESMDWMIDKMAARGIECSLAMPYSDVDGVLDTPAGEHNFWTADAPMGVFQGAPLVAKAWADIFTEDYGGEIDYSTVAQYLIRDDDNTGRVSAVIAQDADGNYIKYEATKAVVLATGDFSKDRDLMARYSPMAYKWFKDAISWDKIDYDTELAYDGLMPGDGQKMGLWIGAAWQKTFPVAPMINGGATGPAHGVISNFWGINLDIHGERYQTEITNFAYGAISKLQLPQQTAFAVWDTNYAYTQDTWEAFGCCIDLENGIQPSTPEEIIAGWDKNAEAGVVEGIGSSTVYYKADTIEELVEKMAADGIDADNALESIKRYNEYAKNGLDEEFHVNPEYLFPIETGPFYATKSVGATFLTVCGGLRTNEKMQVCDENDEPIEGLYNTGIMTGDFYANTYNFVMPGQNLGAVCGTLSYLLGKDLAQL